MDKSRFYFKLLEKLADPTCPICALLLEDSRTYLEALFYEAVLDVPTRMNLMESFGFCSWHARQIPSLPSICAPNVGFAIFASDLLRKFDYLGRAITEERARRSKWKSWFNRKRRRLVALLKERPCPACEHVKQFESYACVPGCGGKSILRYPSLEFFFHNCLITNDLRSAKA